MISPLLLLVTALAVARLTRLVVLDQIATPLRVRAISRFGEESRTAYLVHCFWCTGLWIAMAVVPLALLWPNRYLVAGLSALAVSHVVGLLAKLDRG